MIESIPYVLTGIGIIVSILYYTSVLRNANRTRKTQTTLMLRVDQEQSNFIDLMSMKWTDYEDFLQKYDSTVNPENYKKRWAMWSYYDSVGYMLSQNLVDIDTIYYVLYGYGTLQIWNKFKPIIYAHRKRYNEPIWFKWFEYLAEETMKYRVKIGLPENIVDIDVYPDS